MHTWIKICGTTCVEDALASIAAGADALGFILGPSKRQITPEKAQEIIRLLPRKVEKIGVFLDAGAQQIANVVSRVDLTGIQMHGDRDFPPEVYNHLPADRRDSLRKIKTLIVQDGLVPRLEAVEAMTGIVDTWLLDSGAGSGKTFDWRSAREQLGDRAEKFVLAGGLAPGNVAEAMAIFHPWGVDVASGVEAEPGRKDLRKLNAFVEAVRKAEKQSWAAQH
jgi:phosphoribosylanthranilate isomerase